MKMSASEVRISLSHFICALPHPITARSTIYEEAMRAGFTARELREHGPGACCRAVEMRRESGRIR